MAEIDSIRQMPYSLEAEQAILGIILVDPQKIAKISEKVKAEDFYLERHAVIFNAMTSMFRSNVEIDIVTLIEQITKMGSYSEGDAAKYIKQLVDMSSAATNIDEYVRIIKDKTVLRQLIDAARNISDNAYSEIGEVRDIVESAEKAIYDISADKYSDCFMHIREAIVQALDNYHELEKNPEGATGHKTGFSSLDRYLLGIGPGDLVILGARPGVGKTSFALNIASNIARSSRKEVAIFSLEMTADQLVNRMLSTEAAVHSSALRTGRILPEEWSRIATAASSLSSLDILIDDTSDITTTAMKAKLRRCKNLGLVVIDYLQLIRGESHTDNKVLEVAAITRDLKLMGKDLGVPIILLSQLARRSEQRNEKRPMLSDLRDSGAIEQDADMVIFLNKETASDKNAPPTQGDFEAVECIVAKNRHGAQGIAKLAWYGSTFRFVSVDEDTNEPD